MHDMTDWEKYARNAAARKARRQYAIQNQIVNSISKKLWTKEMRQRIKRTQPVVAKINWVKDTPRSLAIQFIEWRTHREQ
jgi:hypothetical protein